MENIIWPWISVLPVDDIFWGTWRTANRAGRDLSFENGMDHKDGKLLWDVNRLFGEIVAGMKNAKNWERSR